MHKIELLTEAVYYLTLRYPTFVANLNQ